MACPAHQERFKAGVTVRDSPLSAEAYRFNDKNPSPKSKLPQNYEQKNHNHMTPSRKKRSEHMTLESCVCERWSSVTNQWARFSTSSFFANQGPIFQATKRTIALNLFLLCVAGNFAADNGHAAGMAAFGARVSEYRACKFATCSVYADVARACILRDSFLQF